MLVSELANSHESQLRPNHYNFMLLGPNRPKFLQSNSRMIIVYEICYGCICAYENTVCCMAQCAGEKRLQDHPKFSIESRTWVVEVLMAANRTLHSETAVSNE